MRPRHPTPAAPMCVLWIPERRSYVRRGEILQGHIDTTPRPAEARQYRADAAAVASLYLQHQTGMRVELQPCRHSSGRA